ncbi:CPBP family intramembrane glutamic endopeptidase [Jannaschia marina]|uniref:CPBP family intramembrane glutamic endopeptidase n=1 Tax=Jannaschia marina TaxID=2741674 RepID=UPI0015CBFCFB|nr:type II CAAX endopeptidase family protein [Jannaschia marina]
MWTAEFDRFVAPARARPQLWRTLLGFATIAAAYVAGFFAIVVILLVALGPDEGASYLGLFATGGTPTLVVMFLMMFAAPFAATVGVARLLHARPGRGLFGPNLWRDFALATGIAGAIYLVVGLLLPMSFTPEPNTPLTLFLTFLPIALVAILIQTGAEELAFRGYLQQQLAARFRSPLAWMVFPAILFGVIHLDPTAGLEKAWMVLPPTLFGLLAADLTRVTGSIGLAWGLHFLNNCSAFLIVSLKGNMSGLALYTTPFTAEALSLRSPLLWQEMLVTVIVWACIRLWIARRRRPATV